MGLTSNLAAAKRTKNDEYYTQYDTIQQETDALLQHNPNLFQNKTILLPCDDPTQSNFTRFFTKNFRELGLKKLVSTSIATPSNRPDGKGKILVITRHNITNTTNIPDLLNKWEYLDGNGDFRTKEITSQRDQTDFIITNPPYSLFRQFTDWTISNGKQFAIIGNVNAISYKNLATRITHNQIWLGANNKTKKFILPSGDLAQINAVWFTNIQHDQQPPPLQLSTIHKNLQHNRALKNKPWAYQKYDNYNAIEVPVTSAIPSDYKGIMGVPITFLTKYNPNQFHILGTSQRGCHDLVPDTRKYDDYWTVRNGKKGSRNGGSINENPILECDSVDAVGVGGVCYVNDAGRVVRSVYQRIFIQHKQP